MDHDVSSESLPNVEPPVDTVQQVTTTQSLSTERPGWLHTNLRNLIAIALTGVVCYLAVLGSEAAQSSLVAAFGVLVGMIFGERGALKIPGRDS